MDKFRAMAVCKFCLPIQQRELTLADVDLPYPTCPKCDRPMVIIGHKHIVDHMQDKLKEDYQ